MIFEYLAAYSASSVSINKANKIFVLNKICFYGPKINTI